MGVPHRRLARLSDKPVQDKPVQSFRGAKARTNKRIEKCEIQEKEMK